MPNVFPLVPAIRHYAWGDRQFLQALTGVPATGEPWAELWWGAHPEAPATTAVNGQPVPLDALFERQGEALMGPALHRRFAGLPYLTKLLAAAEPLSIQVHPSRQQAQVGFAREERLGIPRDSAARNYRDANHKPELVVALTPFEALAGFRSTAEFQTDLCLAPELAALLPESDDRAESRRRLLTAYFALPEAARSAALEAWLGRLRESPGRPGARTVLNADALARRGGNPDAGLFFFLLLNQIELAPNQGLFIPAGLPHAYLRGAAVEVMASSDNVLRGGLTPKHVDTEEFLGVLDFTLATPQLAVTTRENSAAPDTTDGPGTIHSYAADAEEFELRWIELNPRHPWERTALGPETLVVLDARPSPVRLETEASTLPLPQGSGCLIPHGTRYRLHLDGNLGAARLAHVSVPRGDSGYAI